MTPSRLLYLSLLIIGSYSHDFGGCPELEGPVGVDPSLGTVVTAGQLVIVSVTDHVLLVKTVCDASSGWILADNRFSEVRCSYDARRQQWTWSHQHRDMRSPPLIRCSHVSPRPIEQSYTLVNYSGCHDETIRTDLVKKVAAQLESSLRCCGERKCLIPSVQCSLEGESSKLSVVVRPTMLGSLEEQLQMLSDAGQFLKEFKPVYSSGHIIKRELKMDWNDTDPDNSTVVDCVSGQIIKKINETYSYCVDCNAGMYAEGSNQTCVHCPYDSYSENSTNDQCTKCGNGSGTLTIGSDSSGDCTAVCVVPNVGYTSSMDPPAGGRVVEGGNVTLHCDTNYSYGNLATTDVTCTTNQTNMNNFPSSCRRVTVTVRNMRTSISEANSVTLTCTVSATKAPYRYTWLKDQEEIRSYHNITYNISRFREGDEGSYSCKAEYATPLRDEVSGSLELSVLDLRVTPESGGVVAYYSGEEIKLSCTMRIDSYYPKRSIEWAKYKSDKINSGITISENNSSYVSVLTLDASKVKDTGSYGCAAKYRNDDVWDNLTIHWYFSVAVRGFTEEAQDVSVTVGEEFNIRCSFFAEMEIPLTWEKYSNGRREDISNNTNIIITTTVNPTSIKWANITTTTLTVKNATLFDVGDYTCSSRGNVTRNSSATVSVYDMGIVSSPVDAAYLVGEDATLSCTVVLPGDADSHHVSVKWVKVISPAESLVIPVEKVHFDVTTGVSTLTLLNVSMDDAGGYKCQATYITTQTSFDRNSTKAELFVREMSASLEEYTLVKLSSSSNDSRQTARFTCTYHGDSNVRDVTWTLDEARIGDIHAGYQVITGSYNNSTETWTTWVVVSPVEVYSGGRLACNFSFSNIGAPVVSTTNFIVHSLTELEAEVLSSAETVNVHCVYSGTDAPDTVTWSVDGALLQGDEPDYTIKPGNFTDTNRNSVDGLTVSGRSYSDSKRNITCKYSFTNPQDELQSSTLLIYRGMHSGLQPAYYLTKDSQPVTMECYLGVGWDGAAPGSTKWYWNGTDISDMFGYWNITTDTSPKNGLFKSSLSVSAQHIGLSGKYSCEFVMATADSSPETYSSNTVLHGRILYRSPSDEVRYGYSPTFYYMVFYLSSDEPPANVSWTGPKGPITEGLYVETITISNLNYTTILYLYNMTKPTPEDSGAYTCQVNFLSGPSVEDTFPDIQFRDIKILAPSRLYVTIGVNVSLECKVDSHELLELGWYDIYYEDYIAPTTLTYDNKTTVATLDLTISAVDDAGQFVCARSFVEYSRNNVTVVVLGLSSNFSSITVSDEDEELTLACSADYNYDIKEPSIAWFQDGDEIVNGSISSAISDAGDQFNSYLKVNVTSEVDEKKFHCVATYFGISAASDLVSNTTTIVITKIEAEHVYKVAAVGDNVTFTCNVYSKQHEPVHWRKTVNGSMVNLSGYSEMLPDTPDYLSISVLKLSNVTMETASESIQCWFDAGITKTADMTLNVIDVATTGVEVVRGRRGYLRCSATGSFDVSLSTYWTNSTGAIEHEEPEFGVHGQYDMTYTCNVRLSDRNATGVAHKNASYNVFDIIHPADVIAEGGDVVELSCGVSEHEGEPSFSWYKEGDSTPLTANASYKFTPTSSEDSGDYYCNVSMMYDGQQNGPFKSNSSTVTVRDVRASFTETTLVNYGEPGRVHLRLECSYSGDDSVITVQWETPVGNVTADNHMYNITTSDYANGGVNTWLETREVGEDEKYNCTFITRTGRPISRGTTLTLYRFSELRKYTYNPAQLLVNYTGEIEPNVTWYIAGNQYDETRDTQFTPNESQQTNNTKEFRLDVDMEKFPEGNAPVNVEGKFSFESFPAVNEGVSTRIFKRVITESLEKYVKVQTESEAMFTCVAAGVFNVEDNRFAFSWYLDEAILNGTDVIIANEAVPDSSYSRKSILKINNINLTPDYNGQLRCVATWLEPEQFSVESVSDLDTVGASMDSTFNTLSDGSAVLTCLVWGNDPPKQVTWTNEEGKEVEHLDNQVLIRDVTHDVVHVHTLTFVSVQLAHEGRYTCTVTFADDEERSLETELHFLGAFFDPPSPYFVHDLSEDIEFACIYRGFREPKGVLWFRETEEEGNRLENHTDYTITTRPFNEQTFTQESVVLFKRTGVESNGKYICKWETETLSAVQYMVVAVRTLKTKKEISYSTDGVISLACHYSGVKEGTIRWYHESSEIVSGKTVNITTGKLTENQQTFHLSISEVGVEEAGEYSCVLAFEDGDKVTATTDVVVRQGRILSNYWSEKSLPLIYVEDNVLEIQCRLEGDVVPAYVQWFSEDGKELSFDGRVRRINSNTEPLEAGVRYYSNITLRGDYVDGRYVCKFSFSDGNNVEAAASVLSVSVTSDTCIFVDSRLSTTTRLSCVFQGQVGSVDGVEFELEGGSIVEENVDLKQSLNSSTWEGYYEIVNATSTADGVYTCEFEVDKQAEFSGTQRLTARMAELESSAGRRLVGSTLTLTCTVTDGAKTITWYKDSTELRSYRTLSRRSGDKGLTEEVTISLKVEETSNYTCRGEIYDQYCPYKQHFDSNTVSLEAVPAQPIQSPSNGSAYEGSRHEFQCQFPDGYKGEDYTYNVYWTFNDQRILSNGDVYLNGKRVIDGKIWTSEDNNGGAGPDIIKTSYEITSVDTRSGGYFACAISWSAGIYIKSDKARLSVRSITNPPATTNVAVGGNANLSCTTTGDVPPNSIKFYKSGTGGAYLDGATTSDTNEEGVVTTVAVATLHGVTDASPPAGFWYCEADWGDRTLDSKQAYLSVLSTRAPDSTEVWGVQGYVARMECQSDAALREDGSAYRDQDGRVVYASAHISWEYQDPSSEDWSTVGDNINHFVESPVIGPDGLRRSALSIGPILPDYNDLKFRCKVTYATDKDINFYGGTVFTDGITLKVSKILSFEISPETPIIVGDSFNLVCIAIGTTVPTFQLTNDGWFLDTSRYTITNNSTTVQSNVMHIASYTVQTKEATVSLGGQDFHCSVSYGTGSGKLAETLKVTTYYNCSAATISVLGADPGVSIDYEDDNGDRTAKVTCPADTADTKYALHVTSYANETSTCTKDKGRYNPPYLATCLARHAFDSGKFQQVWTLTSAGFTVCDDTSSAGQYTKLNMVSTLTTNNSACGPYPVVPCLKDDRCTLDNTKTGCRWDDASKKLYVFYKVDFTSPVWTISERRDLAYLPPNTKLRFWDCPVKSQSGRRSLSKSGVFLERMSVDEESDMVSVYETEDEKNYNILIVGVVGIVAVALAIGAFLYRRRRQVTRDDHVVIELTDRTLVMENKHSS